MKRAVTTLGSVALLAATLAGCETNAGTGALVGGAAGAGIGAIIGNNSHHRTGEGALIGGAIGALGGAVVGNEIDKDQARKQAAEEDRYRQDQYNLQQRSRGAYAPRPLTKEDVISMSTRGTRSDVIIDRIDSTGSVFHLTPPDENQLRDAGVDEDVIRVMKDTARR